MAWDGGNSWNRIIFYHQEMKLKKHTNGNVIIIDDAGKEINRVPADWMLWRDLKNAPMYFYASPNGSNGGGVVIDWAKVAHLIKGGVETVWSGTADQLFTELSDNFFIKVSGGGSTDASKLTGTVPDERLSGNITKNSNIKTINGNSILGTGNLSLPGGGDVTTSGTQTLSNKTIANGILSQSFLSGIVGAAANGIADDSTPFQNAIYFAGDNKRILNLPAGTYTLKNQLVLNTPNLVIRGAGIGKTIIKIANDYAGTGAPIITYGKATNLVIEDLEIIGNGKLVEAAIRLNTYDTPTTQNRNVFINRVSIHNFWGIGILGGSSSGGAETHSIDQLTITNCQIYDIGNPAQPITYSDNDLKYDAINLNSTTKKAIIANNYIARVAGDGIFSWGRVQETANHDLGNYIIENNHFESCWMHIEVNGNYLSKGLKINNNLFKFCTRNGGYSLSIDSEHATITNNTFYGIDRPLIEYTAIGGIITGNVGEIRPWSSTSGGTPPTAIVGNCAFIEAYYFENLISNNVFTYPVGRSGAGTFTPPEFRGIKLISRTTDPTYHDLTYDGITDLSAFWNIKGNVISGFTHRAIDCTNEKIRKVNIQNNTFRSRYAVETTIPIYGYDWIIKDNIFDLKDSIPAANNGVVDVFGSQSDNTRSIFLDNLIINDAWKILGATKLVAFRNNFFTTGVTLVGYMLNLAPLVTNAQRLAMTPIEGMFVDQTDGTWRYTSGAWVKQ